MCCNKLYIPTKYAHICFVLLWLYKMFVVDLGDIFTHILQGDTGAVKWQCQYPDGSG